MSSHKKTILVVDDNRTFSLYLAILLKRMGFNVTTAENGMEALRLIKMSLPDLVIMDVNMPVLSGLETLASIRADESISRVPVFLVSAETDEETVRKCEQAGSDAFLPKPVPMSELHDLMQEFVFTRTGFKRRYLRVHSKLKVMLLKDGAAKEMNTESLSEGGVYLGTDNPLPVGTHVDVVLPINGDTFRLRGTVIYTRGRFDDKIPIPSGMAVEFEDVSTREARSLCILVSELMTGDMAGTGGDKMIKMSGVADPCSKIKTRSDRSGSS